MKTDVLVPANVGSLLLENLSAIGSLQAEVKNLRDDNKAAAESRTRLHAKVDVISGQVCQVQTEVNRIVPLVDKHEGEHQQRAGEKRLVGRVYRMRKIIWAVIAGGLALVGIKIGGGLPG